VFKDYGSSKESDAEKLAELKAEIAAETDEAKLAELQAAEKAINGNLGEPINVYAGYLPYTTKKTASKLCPAIAVRPSMVADDENETVVTIDVYVSTYDEDMLFGAESLFHIVERIRHELLSKNPATAKWNIKPGTMKITIPDEQPYPQWLGLVEFGVYLPQPENHSFINDWV
jgi:hypothetical protein